MSRSYHCTRCPLASSPVCASQHPPSFFLKEEPATISFSQEKQCQQRMLHEAIAPYLDVAELRRLAANSGDVQHALSNRECVPEDIQALLSLLRTLLTPRADERIEKPADIAALLMVAMGHLDHEEFWVACLDMKNHVQRLYPLYKGSLNMSVVRTGEVFRLPLLLNSASIILAHNHPSGSTEPGPEDITTTQNIIQAGTILQIEVLDHLIIGQGRWVSMREQRMGGWEKL